MQVSLIYDKEVVSVNSEAKVAKLDFMSDSRFPNNILCTMALFQS